MKIFFLTRFTLLLIVTHKRVLQSVMYSYQGFCLKGKLKIIEGHTVLINRKDEIKTNI